MKTMLDHEYTDERIMPITIAQAIIGFAIGEHEDERDRVEDFIEMIDYLNVYAKHLKGRRMTNVFYNPDV